GGQRPGLLDGAGAGRDLQRGVVAGAGARVVQAQAGALVGQAAGRSLAPGLSTAPVAGAQYHRRPRRGAAALGVQAQAVDPDGAVGLDDPVLLGVVLAGGELDVGARRGTVT